MRRLFAAPIVLLVAGSAYADAPVNISPDAPDKPAATTATPVTGPRGRVRHGGQGGRRPPATTTVGAGGTAVPVLTARYSDGEGGPTAHPEGQYGGVAPDQTHSATDAATPSTRPTRAKRPPAKGTLTWIGFEAKDGGAEVFFQSVAPFTATQTVEGNALVVELGGLYRQVLNTRRPIDTRFFDNPIAEITAHTVGAARATKTRGAHGAGIEVRIAFKNPKDARQAQVRTNTEADGMYYTYLTFPEGADAPATAPTVTTPEQ